MRWFFLLTLIVAVFGSGLYVVKRSIDARYDQLATLQQDIASEKNKSAILNAEWSYLTRPDRLLQLSDKLLSMRPIDADRILPLEAIPVRSSHKGRHAQ